MAKPTPREVCKIFIRQRTPSIVLDKSNERRSKKNGHCSSPINERAISVNTCAGIGSPATRNAPRTRVAGGIRDSKCRSLAPLAAAAPMNDSKSIFGSV